MIKFITGRKEEYEDTGFSAERISFSNITEFHEFTKPLASFQLDIETTMTLDGPNQNEERKVLVVQVGDLARNTQFVFDIIELPPDVLQALIYFLNNTSYKFLGHNIRFEYIVLKAQLGVEIENLHDTYLMSRLLTSGLETPPGFHGLAGLVLKHCNITMDKESQTTFTGEPLTIKQIVYAAYDVEIPYLLYVKLMAMIQREELVEAYNIEREVLKAYSDMELNPMIFDSEHWITVAEDIKESVKEVEEELKELVLEDPKLVYRLKSRKSGDKYLIAPLAVYNIKWSSPLFRKSVLPFIFPTLPTTIVTKPAIKKWFKSNKENLTKIDILHFEAYLEGSYDSLSTLLINDFHDELEELGIYVPEGLVNINWRSTIDKLFIFQFYYPKLPDTNATTLNRIKKNELITTFKKWTSLNKMLTSYGMGFIGKNVKSNNTIAPMKLSQILATGRVSFGILLQMPSESKFRNAILPPEGNVFVDTDYSSMEVLIMAARAGEQTFLDAVRAGKDLHSMSASLMFPDQWKDIAEEGCNHLIDGSRCSCVEHNKLRTFSKSITFGLAYGMSAVGLAERVNVSRNEANDLINLFFKTFPNLAGMLDGDAEFGRLNKYIVGMAPINRRRYYSYPLNSTEVGSIERASKNFP